MMEPNSRRPATYQFVSGTNSGADGRRVFEFEAEDCDEAEEGAEGAAIVVVAGADVDGEVKAN